MIYYIADLHLGHEGILKICNRPFDTIKENDRCIIENWNKVVGAKDDIYIVGNFSYKAKKGIEYYLKKLNGMVISEVLIWCMGMYTITKTLKRNRVLKSANGA